MTILILEDNLMWSPRLAKTVRSLGHEAVVLTHVPEVMPNAEVAILNLGNEKLSGPSVIHALHEQGTKIIAHAGHKEKDLLEAGREHGCDLIVSNGSLTFKLDEHLAAIAPIAGA